MAGAVSSTKRADPRRQALNLALANAALWSAGNGLTSGALIEYLTQDLGARGLELSLLLAAPGVVGLLRLASPWLIRRCGSRRTTCLAAYGASYVVMLTLALLLLGPWRSPATADIDRPSAASVALADAASQSTVAPDRNRQVLLGFIGLVSLHQLLEYIGHVSLWSWLADVVPRQVRGRFFSRRQCWQLGAFVVAVLSAGQFADRWHAAWPEDRVPGYALPMLVGAIALLASTLPLAAMAERSLMSDRRRSAAAANARAAATSMWSALAAPLVDGRFRRLIVYGCWFSFFNGLTTAAQGIYPKYVLRLSVTQISAMKSTMTAGQVLLALGIGRFIDRYGNRPVLIASQWIVAAALGFFLLATPSQPGWLLGAWICWSAYAGTNICLPNLMLKLAPVGHNPSYIAVFETLRSVCHAVSTVLGGLAFDALAGWPGWELPGGWQLGRFQAFFLFGWATRSLGVVWLARIQEPGAWRWREIWRQGSNAGGKQTNT